MRLQQYDHNQYVSDKWETTRQFNDRIQQKTSVKRQTPSLLSISPTEGKAGTMITLVLQNLPVQPVKLAFNSLVVETKQLRSQQHDERTAITTLMSIIPSFQSTLSTTHIVPISVCFFGNNDIIEDTSFLANFTYQLDNYNTTNTIQDKQSHQNERKRPSSYSADDYCSPTPNKRPCQESIISSFSSISYPSHFQQLSDIQDDSHSSSSPSLQQQQKPKPSYSPPSTKVRASFSGYSQQEKLYRQPSLQNLKSTSHQPTTPVANYQPYPGLVNQNNFELVDDLDTMMQNWTVTEQIQGRRLVYFWRKDGPDNLIQCGCKPIAQNDPAATDINNTVVSCIYWPEKDDYYITSVDAIYLLESLMKIHFGVEEKNRIRRNLEGFRPVTVAKCKPISAEFFKRVMGFPHPKPRNIEKDIKAFTWKILPYALKKVITKYAITSTSTITTLNNTPDYYTISRTSTSQQPPLYQDTSTLPLSHSSMLLPPTPLTSSISPDSINTSLSSSHSPLLTPPSATDNDNSFHHPYQQYQRSQKPNKQQLYYNPTTMTYGYQQEPGVRSAHEHKFHSGSPSITTTVPSPSPPLSSTAASPSPPILFSSEPGVLPNGMNSLFITASSLCTSPSTTDQHHQHHIPLYAAATSLNDFQDPVIAATTSLALPSSPNQSASLVFVNDHPPLL